MIKTHKSNVNESIIASKRSWVVFIFCTRSLCGRPHQKSSLVRRVRVPRYSSHHHRIASHRIPSHRFTSHRITLPSIMSRNAYIVCAAGTRTSNVCGAKKRTLTSRQIRRRQRNDDAMRTEPTSLSTSSSGNKNVNNEHTNGDFFHIYLEGQASN